jgi:hypothetical protein
MLRATSTTTTRLSCDDSGIRRTGPQVGTARHGSHTNITTTTDTLGIAVGSQSCIGASVVYKGVDGGGGGDRRVAWGIGEFEIIIPILFYECTE